MWKTKEISITVIFEWFHWTMRIRALYNATVISNRYVAPSISAWMETSWKIKYPDDVWSKRHQHRNRFLVQACSDWEILRCVMQMLEWKFASHDWFFFFSYFFVVVVYLIITWFSHLYNINIYYIKEMWVALFVTYFFPSFFSFIYLVYIFTHLLIYLKSII